MVNAMSEHTPIQIMNSHPDLMFHEKFILQVIRKHTRASFGLLMISTMNLV